MLASRILAFMICLASAAQLVAAEVTVQVKRHGDGAAEAVSGNVLAKSALDPEKSLTAPLPGSLTLPAGDWFLTPRIGDDWGEAEAISVTSEPKTVVLNSYPSTRLSAKVKLPNGKMAHELKVYFQRSDAEDLDVPAGGDVSCELVKNDATCRVPAGQLDLTFRVPGFVSRYRWDAKLQKGKPFDAGVLEFVAGSTLSGRVEVPKSREVKLEQAVVVVRPVSPAGSNEELQRRADSARQTAHPNGRGLFAFNLAAGQYTLQATLGNLISEEVIADVTAGHEAVLRESLRLEPQRTVTVRVHPAADPWMRPWRIELSSVGTTGLVVSSRAATTSPDGSGTFEHVLPGFHTLQILRGQSQEWASQSVNVDRDLTVDVTVDAIPVAGTILIGTKPLEAKATLISDERGSVVTVKSNAEGTFTANLPAPEHDVWDRVIIEADSPPVKRTLENVHLERHDDRPAELHLALPNRTINGTVVDELGLPAKNAFVDVAYPNGEFQQAEAPAGAFTVVGLEAGRYRLSASSRGHHTIEPREFTLDADPVAITDATLVVMPVSHLRGVVRALDTPVLGAVVSPIIPGNDLIIPFRTDPQGQFDISLPDGTQQISLLVSAPGFALRLLKASPSADAQTFAVDQDGGALTVDVPVRSGLVALLSHDGATFPVHGIPFVAGLGYGGDYKQRTSFQVPSMEPGTYSICWKPAGPPPPDTIPPCIEGVLAPHGTLTLKQ